MKKLLLIICISAISLSCSAQFLKLPQDTDEVKHANKPFIQSIGVFAAGMASFVIGKEVDSDLMKGMGLTTIGLSFTMQIDSVDRHRKLKRSRGK